MMKLNSSGSISVLVIGALTAIALGQGVFYQMKGLQRNRLVIAAKKSTILQDLNESAIQVVDQYFANNYFEADGTFDTIKISSVAPLYLYDPAKPNDGLYDPTTKTIAITQCSVSAPVIRKDTFQINPTAGALCREATTLVKFGNIDWGAKKIELSAETEWFTGLQYGSVTVNPKKRTLATLNLDRMELCCLWTAGGGDNKWHNPANWVRCDGGIPHTYARVSIDKNAPIQPHLTPVGFTYPIDNKDDATYPADSPHATIKGFCQGALTPVGSPTLDGGTITIESGIRLFVWDGADAVPSSVKIGGQAGCTDCDLVFACNNCSRNGFLKKYFPRIYNSVTDKWELPTHLMGHVDDWDPKIVDTQTSPVIHSNAKLTFLPGLTVRLTGQLTVGGIYNEGHLEIAGESAANPVTVKSRTGRIFKAWKGIYVKGVSADHRSSLSIENAHVQGSYFQAVRLHSYFSLLKMNDVWFRKRTPQATSEGDNHHYYRGTWDRIVELWLCTDSFVVDTWNNIEMEAAYSRGYGGAIDIRGNCGPSLEIADVPGGATSSKITVSGKGSLYGKLFTNDPNGILNMVDGDSYECEWTGSDDTVWKNPGNWKFCRNGRGEYPDQNDWVKMPKKGGVVRNQPILPSGRSWVQGFKGGNTSATVTVPRWGTLFTYNKSNTFSEGRSVTIQGDSDNCTSCLLETEVGFSIVDNTKLTLTQGLTVFIGRNRQINVGNGLTGGELLLPSLTSQISFTTRGYGNLPVDWYGIRVHGGPGSNSKVKIESAKISWVNGGDSTKSGLTFVDNYQVDKLNNLNVHWRQYDYSRRNSSGDQWSEPRLIKADAVKFENCNQKVDGTWKNLKISGERFVRDRMKYGDYAIHREFTEPDHYDIPLANNITVPTGCLDFNLEVEMDPTSHLNGPSYGEDYDDDPGDFVTFKPPPIL